jgi:hypothetical protein
MTELRSLWGILQSPMQLNRWKMGRFDPGFLEVGYGNMKRV